MSVKTNKQEFCFFHRFGEHPGITVSKRDKLPTGDFGITEYTFQRWGYVVLWFIDDDKFTDSERERAYSQYLDSN